MRSGRVDLLRKLATAPLSSSSPQQLVRSFAKDGLVLEYAPAAGGASASDGDGDADEDGDIGVHLFQLTFAGTLAPSKVIEGLRKVYDKVSDAVPCVHKPPAPKQSCSKVALATAALADEEKAVRKLQAEVDKEEASLLKDTITHESDRETKLKELQKREKELGPAREALTLAEARFKEVRRTNDRAKRDAELRVRLAPIWDRFVFGIGIVRREPCSLSLATQAPSEPCLVSLAVDATGVVRLNVAAMPQIVSVSTRLHARAYSTSTHQGAPPTTQERRGGFLGWLSKATGAAAETHSSLSKGGSSMVCKDMARLLHVHAREKDRFRTERRQEKTAKEASDEKDTASAKFMSVDMQIKNLQLELKKLQTFQPDKLRQALKRSEASLAAAELGRGAKLKDVRLYESWHSCTLALPRAAASACIRESVQRRVIVHKLEDACIDCELTAETSGRGLLVGRVSEHGAAQIAGLLPGDIIRSCVELREGMRASEAQDACQMVNLLSAADTSLRHFLLHHGGQLQLGASHKMPEDEFVTMYRAHCESAGLKPLLQEIELQQATTRSKDAVTTKEVLLHRKAAAACLTASSLRLASYRQPSSFSPLENSLKGLRTLRSPL